MFSCIKCLYPCFNFDNEYTQSTYGTDDLINAPFRTYIVFGKNKNRMLRSLAANT